MWFWANHFCSQLQGKPPFLSSSQRVAITSTRVPEQWFPTWGLRPPGAYETLFTIIDVGAACKMLHFCNVFSQPPNREKWFWKKKIQGDSIYLTTFGNLWYSTYMFLKAQFLPDSSGVRLYVPTGYHIVKGGPEAKTVGNHCSRVSQTLPWLNNLCTREECSWYNLCEVQWVLFKNLWG